MLNWGKKEPFSSLRGQSPAVGLMLAGGRAEYTGGKGGCVQIKLHVALTQRISSKLQ